MAKINNTAVALVGVRWQQELGIKSYWATHGSFPAHPGEILVGRRAATDLGISNGDKVSILGQDVIVSGILFETGIDDDTVVLMDLSTSYRV